MGTSRICVNCGKVVAPDRKQRCDHCGEWFYARGDPIGPNLVAEPDTTATFTSGRGLLVGLILALAIPVSFGVLAALAQSGIVPSDRAHALLDTLGAIALVELLVGPIGIAITGWSAGVRGLLAWVALIIVSVPALAVVWFVSVVTLSGALGEPF